jgi:ATP-dependent DNA helicase PIF1
MRFGKLSSQNKSRLVALSRQVRYRDSVEPTELYAPATLLERHSFDRCFYRFPTKREVQFANDSRLGKLTGPPHTFRAMDSPGKDDKDQYITYQQATSQLDRCVLAPEVMTLKVGNSTLRTSNGLTPLALDRRTGDVDQGTGVAVHVTHILTLRQNVVQGELVNGSVGKVTDFLTCHEAKEIHHIEIALSPRDKEENPKTGEIRIAEQLWRNPTKWPVVEFPGNRKRLIPPHEFTIENAGCSMQALRLQVPLI